MENAEKKDLSSDVGGGADVGTTSTTSTSSNTMIKVSSDLPSLNECYEFVCDDTCGAVTTFVGTTRNNFNGKVVTKLSYEGYIPMAEKELLKVCDESRTKFNGISKIAACHIIGDCPVGSPSVILAVSSPHRRDALHCIEFLIDELKARVPIWKLEVYEGSTSVWKENIEWHNGQQKRIMVEKQQQAEEQEK